MVNKSENGFCFVFFLLHSQLKSGHDHFIALVAVSFSLLFLLLVSQLFQLPNQPVLTLKTQNWTHSIHVALSLVRVNASI